MDPSTRFARRLLSRTAPGARRRTCRALMAAALALCTLLAQLIAMAAPADRNHSALWFNPARDGEGWVLEMIGGGRAALAWFTYDEAGNQRWLFGVGTLVDAGAARRIEFADLYVTRGGRFGPDFDPAAVQRERVGSASLDFVDCHQGTFSYNAFGQSQALPIERLAHTMAADCRSLNGMPGEPIQAHAAQSGSWFDPARDGEGFQLQWTSRNQALLGWYTYDHDGNQLWLTGLGRLDQGRIVFPMLQTTRGARFGEAFDPADVQRIDWGSLELVLDCDAGTLRYDSNQPAFGSGEYPLVPLTRATAAGCPWVAPKLTDLYDVTLIEIPIDPGTPLATNMIRGKSINDDGTIAGTRTTPIRHELVVWSPARQVWETATGPYLSDDPAQLAPDGNTVLVSASGLDPAQPRQAPQLWNAERGLELLDGLTFDESRAIRASRDFSRIVGNGRPTGDVLQYPWIWDAERGQVELPRSTETPGASPRAVADDGRVVIGDTILGFSGDFPIPGGVIWKDGGPPVLLRDPTGGVLGPPASCSADCRVIYGTGASIEPSHPNAGEAWYLRDGSTFGFLGKLPGTTRGFGISETSSDGTLAVGAGSAPNGQTLAVVGVIWTQITGPLTVPDLLGELGEPALDWDAMRAVAVSPDGRRILLIGDRRIGPGPVGGTFGRLVYTAAVLELSPRQAPQ